MNNEVLDSLEKEYATKDVRVFNALRELRLELRIATRAFGEIYAEMYPSKPPIQATIYTK